MGWEEGFAFSPLVRRWQWQVPVLPVRSLGMHWDRSVAIPGLQTPSPKGHDGQKDFLWNLWTRNKSIPDLSLTLFHGRCCGAP